MAITYAFIVILFGNSFVMDTGLTQEDCAARVTEYQWQADALVCEADSVIEYDIRPTHDYG